MERCVVVTGCNRGIGLELVDKFAENKYHVFACMRELDEEIKKRFEIMEQQYNVIITPICFDLTNIDEMKLAVSEIKNHTDEIDVLVNNAGISITGLFGMIKKEDLQKQMDVNFFAPILFSQYISKFMKKRKNACIVNIGSVSALKNEIGGLVYGASKAALIYATRTMANELGKFGIRVNCVSPGFIDTDMWKNRKEEVREKLIEETPLKRQGTTQDVANMVYFIASEEATFVTGENIAINGGR